MAISKVFRSAMSGTCNDRPELTQTEMTLTAHRCRARSWS
ncbi:MAG TPA: hypothetical protein DD473_18840 [Planctomycetaceae bacterium]|nr:hypothetical protein [Planctomycetaceae bacterium]